ncbi:hypothetical protein L249_4819 [Ophiocordyceps polyrhachis-furcata BCC 54312]|uniref:Uncharacterized protein n=1 Tax=Ophiocordyceps polyrhachis-furcata BCC 54312 TaxID=1330021 RepID=A0A367L2S0_9HYPO|nr:hypothetical protein L249_4819 [Ophiocordyceps polyrhachis-furcata BCC 54312]
MDDVFQAERIFDDIGHSYETAYGNNPGLDSLLARVGQHVSPDASVLDVGCGTGQPVSAYFAGKGCAVTGIDVSQVMVDLCRSKIKGSFIKADMTTFEPEGKKKFHVVLAIFSMLQMPYSNVCSMVYRLASFLRPDGLLCLGTLTAEFVRGIIDDHHDRDPTGDYIEGVLAPFMGKTVRITALSEAAWLRIVKQAGLSIKSAEHASVQPDDPSALEEKHFFIIAQRQHLHPLLGPYPLPLQPPAPHRLDQAGWQPLAERFIRSELPAVLEAVKDNKEVLDVGSGHGELPMAIAKRVGKAYAIEPNSDRSKLLVDKGKGSNVHIATGTAEALPYADKTFDAVVAMWILHYVDDVEKSLSEMTRVVDREAPEARIVIVQGAPYNEAVDMINAVCGPIVDKIDHQGYFLSKACHVFRARGFGDIALEPVNVTCAFPEEELSVRCSTAAEVLANFWYCSHAKVEDMKKAFIPVLERHFKYKPFEVGDQAVMLVARPSL